VSRAQRSTISAVRASSTRYGDALQTRDRNEFRLFGGPGSAQQHFVPQRVRDTFMDQVSLSGKLYVRA
jgi:hypothetical protein